MPRLEMTNTWNHEIRFWLIIALFSTITISFSDSTFSQDQEPSNKKIRLAYSYDLLYGNEVDGSDIGMLVPLIKLFQKEFGIEVECHKLSRNEALSQIDDGRMDFYGLVGLSPGHLTEYMSIGSLYRAEAAIISRIDHPMYSLIQLEGQKVGVMSGSTLVRTVSNFVDSDEMLVTYPSLEAMLEALEANEIDCFAASSGPEIEILRRPNVRVELLLRNYFVNQGIIFKREELKPIAERINHYLNSPKGVELIDEIIRSRKEAILRKERELLADEIAYVREHFKVVKMFDNGAFYPLCYKEKGKYDGLAIDICGVFTELTGIEVQNDEFDYGEDGSLSATEGVRTGQCHLSIGGYANTTLLRQQGFDFSPTIWTDRIRPFTYGTLRTEFSKARVGIPPNIAPLFSWDHFFENPPVSYGSRAGLAEALKKNELDIAFFGQMVLNYQHVVHKDFKFRELDSPTTEINMHLVYNTKNPELNRLFDESIRLYQILYPQAREQWQKKAELANNDYILTREKDHRRWLWFSAVLVTLMIVILLLLHRFMKYDWQIRKLLRKQPNFDLAWGDLRKRRFISKGNHPFFRVWGLDFSGSACSFEEMGRVFGGRDVESEYRADMKKMKAEGLDFITMDGSVVSPLDGETKYYRRYFHRLNDHQFMLCIQDMCAQHESEQQEQFLTQLFAAFKKGLLFLDKDLNILRYNQAMEELFPHYDPTKKQCYECFRNNSKPCEDCPIRETFQDGEKHVSVVHNEETGRWLELSSYPILNMKTGEVERVFEFVQDITEQREREADLKRRENFLSAILNASNDGIIAISDAEDGTHFNSRLVEMFGGQKSDFFNNDDPKVREAHKLTTINPEDIYAARDRNRVTHEPENGILYYRDGRIIQWRLASTETGIGETGYTRIWTFRDITEEQRAAERIRKSEENFRTLFEKMPVGLALFDVEKDQNGEPSRFLYSQINPALEKLDGYTSQQVKGRSIQDVLPDVHLISENYEPIETEEYWMLQFGRAALHDESGNYLVYNDKNGIYHRLTVFSTGLNHLGVFVMDVTPMVMAAKSLQESEQRFRILFESMTNGLMLLDIVRDENGRPIDYLVTRCNPVFATLLSGTEENLFGHSLLQLVNRTTLVSHDFDHWSDALDLAADGMGGTYHLEVDVEHKPLNLEMVIFPAGKNQVGLLAYDETERIIATRALQESEQRIRSLFASMTNGVVLLNIIRGEEGSPIDYIATNANPAYCTALGQSIETLRNNSYLKLFDATTVITEEFGDYWWGGIDWAAAGYAGTYHIQLPQIENAPYQEVVIFPVGKNQVGLLIYDETFRVEADKRLKLMQLIIDRISQPVVWLFLDGTIQYANEAAAVAWGYESSAPVPDGPVGAKVWVFDESVDSETWQQYVDLFDNTSFRQFDTVMRRRNGSFFPAVVIVNLLKQHGKPFFAICFQDLTEQTARIKAEQRDLAKSSFLDHMTHEIRTPLNGVIGITDLMLGTNLDEKQREYVGIIHTASQQLLHIVSDILDFTSIDAGKLVLRDENFNLHDLIDLLHRKMLSMVEERKSSVEIFFTVRSEVPQVIFGDPEHLRQILLNLLDNALKFTEQGKIAVDVSVVEQHLKKTGDADNPSGYCLEFTVTDTGIGISNEKIEDLFEAFAMGDASFSRKYGGTGLGLAISRGLVHQMGGEVYVESEVGVGSKFWFVIPLKTEQKNILKHETVVDEEPPRHRSPSEISILVVEDNRINRIVTGEILKQVGYNFVFAENGLEACKKVAEMPFDLILMDCQMPVMDGFEATQKIRAMEQGRDELWAAHEGRIPIVALTANTLAGDEQNCLDAGMDAFCSKPVNAEQLINEVQSWLNSL